MNINFSSLNLQCRQSREVINFSPQVSYFHGQISAGKSSIMRLIDYCLGGKLERTPAISHELISAELLSNIGDYKVLFERDVKESSYVQVTWQDEEGNSSTVLASIQAQDNPIWEGDIYNLSTAFRYNVPSLASSLATV